VIHVIGDNARTPKPERSTAVRDDLKKWGRRVVLPYLPT
jgi:hypothetical protein